MVLRGFKEEEEEETEPMETSPKRPKPLHNFTLPFLKWGAQRHLRCSNAAVKNPAGASTNSDRRSSKSYSNESTSTRNPASSSERPMVCDDEEDEGIDVVREKLMHDLKTATDRMKDAILRDEEEKEETETVVKSWNLRTRQKKPPVTVAADKVKREFYSPAKIEGAVNVSTRLRRNINNNDNKTERPKFSVQLSRKEIEEDFMAMVGHRPPRRPYKRPKPVQKQLNVSCFFLPFIYSLQHLLSVVFPLI